MGNLCGKESKDSDPFDQPGRRVGAGGAPQSPSKTVPVPKKVAGPGRTLGGSQQGASSSGAAPDEARRKAAEAAEARSKGSGKPAGKLQTQLNAQKSKSRTDTVKEASQQERQAREADQAAQARNWD